MKTADERDPEHVERARRTNGGKRRLCLVFIEDISVMDVQRRIILFFREHEVNSSDLEDENKNLAFELYYADISFQECHST